MIKKLQILLVGALLVSSQSKKYNVLMLIIDDLQSSIGAFGDPIAKTPNMDALADQGILFKGMNVIKSECAPSRLSFLSGRRIDAIRVWDFEKTFRKKNPRLMTLPGVLREQGYSAYSFGKVLHHTSFAGSQNMDQCKRSSSKYCSWNYAVDFMKLFKSAKRHCGVSRVREYPGKRWRHHSSLSYAFNNRFEKYTLDVCIRKLGAKYISKRSRSGKPWFIAVGFYLPHMPWVYPKSMVGYYKEYSDSELLAKNAALSNSSVFFSEESSVFTRSNNKEIIKYKRHPGDAKKIRDYYTSVSYVDKQVGKLMQTFNKLPEATRNNTMVILWSDHGFHLGEHGLWGKKTNLEQATNAPLIIVPPVHYLSETENEGIGGSVVNAPVEAHDVFQTVLDVCGLEDSSGQKRAGTSLVKFFTNPTSFVRAAAVSQYWAHNTEKKRVYMGYSIRTMRYRYIIYMKFNRNTRDPLQYVSNTRYGRAELYDYNDGPVEKTNRAEDESYAGIVAKFEELIARNDDRDWTSLIGIQPFDFS